MSTGRPSAELMEEIMRNFKWEAPGRRRKSSSRINAAATTNRRLEERSFTAALLELRRTSSSSYEVERTLPSSFIEKMQDNLAQKQNAIPPSGLAILIVRRL